ncbi:CD9 antigen-like isoform X2 [Gadus chalcogrammus]|uniref:CD9 antigen-like isoform X2 n=1 Tax=Gadus chalcogrammus TaxID=1042646 RepID=UPI0024C3E354|nr:CD9 antigen-like isoform X2 [Gadus chalcogrammus]
MMAVCGILCKSVILIFNILYTVVGLAFLGVGVWLRARYPDASSGSGDYVLIAVGIVMLITAITGDIGGCGNKSFSLATFCVLLVVLMAAQLALYVQREKVDHRLVEFYVFLYTIYITAAAGDPVVAGTLRVIHYTMDCCGAVGLVGVDPISHTCPDPSGFLDRFMSPCPSVLVDVMGKGPPLAMGIFYGNAMLMVATLAAAGILLGLKRKPMTHQLLPQNIGVY